MIDELVVMPPFWQAIREKLKGRQQVFGGGEETLGGCFVERCTDDTIYYWINLGNRVKDLKNRVICSLQRKTKKI